jgi:hypothetical protein
VFGPHLLDDVGRRSPASWRGDGRQARNFHHAVLKLQDAKYFSGATS